MEQTFATYLRVSTQKQGRSGLGLDAQRKMCADFIAAHNGVGVQEFVDVESGTHRDRKGLLAAIDYCITNNVPLVIAKLDRLARDVEFCFKVVNTGIEIHFTDMPVINSLLLGVFAAVAQYERELTSDRTKKALAVKKAQGAKLGAASETYRNNRAQKSAEEREEIARKKGNTRTRRYLESRDVQALCKILRRTFTDACEGDVSDWDWSRINTHRENRLNILRMMDDVHAMNTDIFAKWDFSDIESVQLQVKLASLIRNIRTAVLRNY